uniref:Protein huluwa-like n=1 Tax=Gadus morhua TaxID=8049 RepID=A0A8C5AVW8_GADMO
MSTVGVASTNLHDAFPVTTLTILILSLIPCVLILLLLNCLFLAYKLLNISRNKRQTHQQDSEQMLLHSCVSTRHRVARITEEPFFQSQGRRMSTSMSEPTLPGPVTSSRTSSKENVPGEHGLRFLRPDGATGTGSGSLTAPMDWCRSARLLWQFSDSDVDTRSDHAPPNSPAVNLRPVLRLFDKMELECEYQLPDTSARRRSSCLSSSMVGPGLDSDFGASAGVSLRIVSADSDDLTNGVMAVALEWDYYDPCYVQQNGVPVQKPGRPSIHSKQYWV